MPSEKEYSVRVPDPPMYSPKDFSKLANSADDANKNRRISFRVTEGLYQLIEDMAESRGITISKLMQNIVTIGVSDGILNHALARYLNSVEPDVREYCIVGENYLPPAYRRIAKLLKKYPDAKPLNTNQLDAINVMIRAANEGNSYNDSTEILVSILTAFEEADVNDRA